MAYLQSRTDSIFRMDGLEAGKGGAKGDCKASIIGTERMELSLMGTERTTEGAAN